MITFRKTYAALAAAGAGAGAAAGAENKVLVKSNMTKSLAHSLSSVHPSLIRIGMYMSLNYQDKLPGASAFAAGAGAIGRKRGMTN